MGLFATALNDLQKHEGYTIMSVAFPDAQPSWLGCVHHTDKVS
jgi:hypothetical protein